MLNKEYVVYKQGNDEFVGYLVYDDASSKKLPGILLGHAWKGLDAFVKKKAEELAQAGYVTFCMDVYGNGRTAETDDEAAALMKPLFINRTLLQARTLAALDQIKKQKTVDLQKIGAIGFCFGGLTVLELAKSGADVKGVVSFHGLLGPHMDDMQANLAPRKSILSKLLVLHGHDDPLVSEEDIRNFQREMSELKVDWQMHIYSQTQHAFMNPDAHNTAMGLIYNATSAKRAWSSMLSFFEEIFL